jgi:hypothetical protein
MMAVSGFWKDWGMVIFAGIVVPIFFRIMVCGGFLRFGQD